jgi:diguanylate cyclase (GGDEF)-like protein/PAS domain S-box-containing protein
LSSDAITVIIADNDHELLDSQRKVLLLEGFSVVTSTDGFDLIEKSFTHNPALILCSYLLGGIGGLKVCRFLRSYSNFSTVPIVLVSSRKDRSEELRARWAGADRLVEQPLENDELVAICREFSRGRDGEDLPAPPPPDRSAVLSGLSEILERRIHHLEAVRELAAELKDSISVLETFRRIANGVLVGLGFERVCVVRLAAGMDRLETEAMQGRGLSLPADAVLLREGCTAALAIAEKRQVRAVELDLPKGRLAWGGSLDYVDTPLIAGNRLLGLIRCDYAVSGRSFLAEELLALSHYADHAASALFNAMSIEEVSESRTRMTTVLAGLESGLILVDRSGRILEATNRFGELFGKPPDTLHGRLLSEAVPLLTTDARQDVLDRVIEKGKTSVEHDVIRNRSGMPDMILNIRHVPFRRGGHITGAVVIVDDVTEESRLRENLRKRSMELEMISRAARELNSTRDVYEISRNLLRILGQFYPDEYIAVMTPETLCEGIKVDSLLITCSSGYPALHDPAGSRMEIEKGSPGETLSAPDSLCPGIVGSAFRSERPLNIVDTSQDSRYIANLPGIRSELAVPMVVEERGVVGIIDIQSRTLERFSSDSVRRVTTLANHAATAVENALLHEQILEMAQRDKLTGLRNLRFFETRLEEEQARARRYDYPYSLIMVDIDDFKHYNDNFGHPMGNVLLQQVARAIESALREVDILVRYGGEEFVCILPLTSSMEAAEIAERIRIAVQDCSSSIPHSSEQPGGFVTVSLGVSSYLTDPGDAAGLLELADQRMYRAKRAGKNQVCAPALDNI